MTVGEGYEFFDHTADIGIRATGRTQEELFVRMAQGLIELLVEDSVLAPTTRRAVHVSADRIDTLLLAWLQELLFWFSTERFLPAQYTFTTMTATSLEGEVQGDIFDRSRHAQGREVKAITRHLLEVRQRHGAWQGQVIVDI